MIGCSNTRPYYTVYYSIIQDHGPWGGINVFHKTRFSSKNRSKTKTVSRTHVRVGVTIIELILHRSPDCPPTVLLYFAS